MISDIQNKIVLDLEYSKPDIARTKIIIGDVELLYDHLLDQLGGAAKIVLLIDEKVEALWGNIITGVISPMGLKLSTQIIPAGENTKSLQLLEKVAEQLIAEGIGRQDILIACGGGVVGDFGGLLASLYMRGVRLIQVPTTLVAQGDSAIGGKTAVNLINAKNAVGTFYPAELTVSDVKFLTTLSDREYAAGLVEVIKHGILRSKEFLDWIKSNLEKVKTREVLCLKEIVEFSSRTKLSFIAEDLEDRKGIRALLNLGHTVGHAVETLTNYQRFLHGEAVAVGLVEALKFGVDKGVTESRLLTETQELLYEFGLPTAIPDGLLSLSDFGSKAKSAEQIWEAAIRTDKKRESKTLKFVLVRKEGEAFTMDIAPKEIVESILRN